MDAGIGTTTARDLDGKAAPSRRDAIRLAVAALAGAGVSLLSPGTAWAADKPTRSGGIRVANAGDNLVLGSSNDANTSETSVTSTTSGYTILAMNTASDGSAFKASQTGNSIYWAARVSNDGSSFSLLVDAVGSGSHLMLTPKLASGPLTSGVHYLGEIVMDGNGLPWRCVSQGTPGTWVPMTSTVLLAAPHRVIDTRSGAGGISGALNSGKVYTFNSFLASAGIPANATGIVGNLTMVAPSGSMLAGAAWMAIVAATMGNGVTTPAGYPGVSTINAPVDTDACANQFTCALGKGTYAGKISIVKSGGMKLHAIVDVAGYII